MPFDPNGALHWKGKYHLCYIFQDERGHCWGHASSTDLVHWDKGPVVFRSREPNLWAPDVFLEPGDGKFYLYYTVNMRIGVADSKRMAHRA